MKTIYKILFSVCSTLVCTIYSVRSFAAACTAVASTAGSIQSYIGGIDNCVTGKTTTSYYKDENKIVVVYGCQGGCKDKYYRLASTVTFWPGTTSCALTYYTCQSCPKLYNVAGSGAGLVSGITACFIPKNVTVTETGGSTFVFDADCKYTNS